MSEQIITSLNHLNGNLLCAIDVETTGLIPGTHDIASICILPLDEQIQPHPHLMPFHMTLQPKRPDNADPVALKLCHFKLSDLILEGTDPWRAVDLFDEWMTELMLPPNKKIVPLAHNWVFDRSWLIDWMGNVSFEHYFHFMYRDPLPIANYLQDVADFRCEIQKPFTHFKLGYIARKLDVDVDSFGKLHDCMVDAVVCAETYRRLVLKYGQIVPVL